MCIDINDVRFYFQAAKIEAEISVNPENYSKSFKGEFVAGHLNNLD